MKVPASFLSRVAGVLETPSVTPETRFCDVDGWCSLSMFGLLVLIENEFKTCLVITDFQSIDNVGQLYIAGDWPAFASSVLDVPREKVTLATAYHSIPEWDSVQHLRLVMEFEERYDIAIPMGKVATLRTIGDFLSVPMR